MGDVKRFDKVLGDDYHPTCSMEESSDGDWVEWEAHRARVAELEGEVGRLAKELNVAKSQRGSQRVQLRASIARAEAAEAREAGLCEALVKIRAFVRPIWSDARKGDEMKQINADCLDDVCDMVDAALAAPAKGKGDSE